MFPDRGSRLKAKHKTNLNAYLFANLAILCVLLISLWNRKPVWDVNLRFPNLLLILVIINSILIFKNLLFAQAASRAGRKLAKAKTAGHSSLESLRGILQKADTIAEPVFEQLLDKLLELGKSEVVVLYTPEGNYFKVFAARGQMPVALSGARFNFRDNSLFIKFPGNLGEEETGKIKTVNAPILFKSSITRLEARIFPLQLKSGIALLVFAAVENLKAARLPFSSTCLFFETTLAMIDYAAGSGDQRYKDKATGLLKHDCFADSFETEIERSERYQQEMTLFTVKLQIAPETDGNDRQTLQKAVAISLKQSLRRLDLMFCGDSEVEFLAILTETSAQVAEIVAQRVQKSFAKQIEKTKFYSSDEKILFIGSATYPTHATHGLGLLEKSREALINAENDKKDFVSYSLNE